MRENMPDERNIRGNSSMEFKKESIDERNRNPREDSRYENFEIQSLLPEVEGQREPRKTQRKSKMNQFYMSNYSSSKKKFNNMKDDFYHKESQKLNQEKDTVFQELENIDKKDQEQGKEAQEKGKVNNGFSLAFELMNMYKFKLFDEQLYTYDDQEGYWNLIPESDANRKLRSMIPDIFCNYVNKNTLREMYEWIRVGVTSMECDKEERKRYINFRNCILDWETGETWEHDSKYNLRYQLQIDYVECDEDLRYNNSLFYRFVEDVFGDDSDTIREFSKFMGLCLSDIRWLKLCFFLYGPSNTGKSVFLNLLKLLIGEKWTSSVSFAQMSNEFAVTQLLGKRINLSGEVSGTTNKRLDIFKSLTGNDTITACFKGKDHFQFVNECLLVFACNDFPSMQSPGDFESFLSRIVVFPFKNVKERSEWIDDLENKLLEDKIHIIQMAIEGLHFLKEDGFCFIESQAMKQCKQDFVGQCNSFLLFADNHIIKDKDNIITSNEIKEAYVNFCEEEDYHIMSDNVWVPILKQRFQCIPKIVHIFDEGGNKYRARGYKGVALKGV